MAFDPKNLNPTSPPAELAGLSPQQLAALGATARPLEGPVANAATTLVVQAANDAMLVFGRPRPLITPDGAFANLATTETVAIIHMSMATLKDLHWAIGEQLQQYESTHGEIITDAMKQRAAQKK